MVAYNQRPKATTGGRSARRSKEGSMSVARSFAGLTLVVLMVLLAPGVDAQDTARTTWDLTEMYPDQAAFLETRDLVSGRIPAIEGCRGTLGSSAQRMAQCLNLASDLRREYVKLAIYAGLSSDLDLRNAGDQQLKAETQRVGVELRTASSWIDPEIVGLGQATIDAFLAEDPELQPHAFNLRETLRQAEHTLGFEQEALLSRTGLFSGKFSEIYQQLTVSDIPYPTVDLLGIGEIRLDKQAYVTYRGFDDRDVRFEVFKTFWGIYSQYENTLGTLLNAEVQKNWFYASSREYESVLEASLDRNDIPVDVYTTLISDVRSNLPVLYRMLDLRRRILGLDALAYSDIYASILPQVDATTPWEDGKNIVLEAFAPLGEDYVATAATGLDRWIDVYPADGKRGGAYSSGGWYDGHPWVLLNYNDSFDSVSTAAHEMGHAMHSWLSNRTQPYPTSGYSIMAAEVSSTFNEALLKEHLLANQSDPGLRILVLGDFLERFRQTVFRQTMFAEFELEVHRRAEAGESLTGESLSEIYLDLLRTYHGHDLGVMEIDELYGIEWAFIPHFYRGFYVYQYATGMVASTALAEKVLAGEPGATERYLQFLASGGSDDPIELLKRAGVDLESSEPFNTAIRAVNRAMDEIELALQTIAAEN